MPDGITCSGLSSPDLKPDSDDPAAPVDRLMESCELGLAGDAQFAGGTIVGVTHYVERGGMNTKGATDYHGPYVFDDGTVVECGTGDFVLETYGGKMDFEHPHASETRDPRDTWFEGFNYWRLEPGSTSSDGGPFLLSGSGENHWKYYAFRTGNTSPIGAGVYTGTMTCAARKR